MIGAGELADPALPRLKTRAQFQAVLGHATRARTAHFALHMLPLAALQAHRVPSSPEDGFVAPGVQTAEAPAPPLFHGGGVWLGAMTPKRWARRAVTRNAIRRQIYAMAATEGTPPAAHADVAWVVRLRAGFDRKTFISASSEALKQAVRTELRQLWARAAS